eukprot:1302545-Pyramimonas_sp.AAC.1
MATDETLHWAKKTHASTATGDFGGAPYGATKRCTGSGKRMRTPPRNLRLSSAWSHETLTGRGKRMRAPPRGTSVELAPYGATRR